MSRLLHAEKAAGTSATAGTSPRSASDQTRRQALTGSSLLALGLLLIVLITLGFGIGWPLIQAHDDGADQLAEMRHRLEKYQQMVAVRPVLEQRHAELQHLRSLQGAYISAGSGALAAAELQALLKRQVGGVGERLTSVQVNPEQEEGRHLRVGVSVKMRTSLSNLVRLFYALETGRPVLFIDQVRLRSLSATTYRKNSPQDQLDVSFDLYGYMRRDSS